MLENNIKDLEHKNLEIMIDKNKKIDELRVINNKYNQKIQELNKQLKENEEYFNNNEKNRIKTQEEIKELNELNDKLNKEKQKVKKELNDKKTLLDEYKNEINILDLRYRRKIQDRK